ncbi:MAG: diacylglycerol kinase family protein [Chloroflexi bacterium]|nr:diacylglycerol kinase family protein [Chloroflexota bacterium]
MASISVMVLAGWLRLSVRDWAVLILTIATVWTAEFLNSALEAVVDLASPNRHPLAKVGKDVGAAAVLISAVSAVIIGFMLLGPPLWLRLRPLFGLP